MPAATPRPTISNTTGLRIWMSWLSQTRSPLPSRTSTTIENASRSRPSQPKVRQSRRNTSPIAPPARPQLINHHGSRNHPISGPSAGIPARRPRDRSEILGQGLLHRAGQQAELVALRVGQHHPADIGSLSDITPARTEFPQPLEFPGSADPVGPQVE